jgi:AbrB family looped-hinge helix DNA binding protein
VRPVGSGSDVLVATAVEARYLSVGIVVNRNKLSSHETRKIAKLRVINQLRLEGGRVTLPLSVRQKLGLKEGDELLLTLEGNRLILESEAVLLENLYNIKQ